MSATDFYQALKLSTFGWGNLSLATLLLNNQDVLAQYVGATEADADYVEYCWVTATDMVTSYIGTAAVPNNVAARAVMEVGSELYHRRNAPNGIAQFTTFDGSAIRVARDPMVGCYPLLRRYVGWGIA